MAELIATSAPCLMDSSILYADAQDEISTTMHMGIELMFHTFKSIRVPLMADVPFLFARSHSLKRTFYAEVDV